uniref:Uncharacterized protein n=1 Tax=Anguilla anguilla TaxID=7936 RepID=A0A0E9TEB7_ANGAN
MEVLVTLDTACFQDYTVNKEEGHENKTSFGLF